MSPVIIAQLIIALGPKAIDLITSLSAVWTKPELTHEEVLAILTVIDKDYDDYAKEAGVTPPTP